MPHARRKTHSRRKTRSKLTTKQLKQRRFAAQVRAFRLRLANHSSGGSGPILQRASVAKLRRHFGLKNPHAKR